MAWTTPRTWTTGELVTASIMNTYVRDQQTELARIGQYRCCAYDTGNQTVSAGAITALALASELYDTASMHNTVTNNSRVVMPVSDVYEIYGTSLVNSTNNGGAGLHLYKNGAALTPVVQASFTTAATNFEDHYMHVYQVLSLGAAEYVELMGGAVSNSFSFQNSRLVVRGMVAVI